METQFDDPQVSDNFLLGVTEGIDTQQPQEEIFIPEDVVVEQPSTKIEQPAAVVEQPAAVVQEKPIDSASDSSS